MLRKALLGLAAWNTVVAAINVLVLPLFAPAEAMVYVTPTSQVLPIIIPLVLLSRVNAQAERALSEARAFATSLRA